ncbi:MAG: hypothetical protein AABW50_01540 [Nanoarchaeota archaeon]
MSLISNLGYILLGFIGIISIFLIILTFLEKKLHIKFLQHRFTPNQLYIKKIAMVNIEKPEESLHYLDKVGKSFFREAFHVSGAPEYSELSEIFERKNNKKAKEFCERMTLLLYSGSKIDKDSIQELLKQLAEIVAGNKIITKEEKEILDKKAAQNNPSKKGIASKIKFLGKKKR